MRLHETLEEVVFITELHILLDDDDEVVVLEEIQQVIRQLVMVELVQQILSLEHLLHTLDEEVVEYFTLVVDELLVLEIDDEEMDEYKHKVQHERQILVDDDDDEVLQQHDESEEVA